ncbi:hypothetical protein C8R45DRAFT_1217346, partial [Mycena sanguinolenta]
VHGDESNYASLPWRRSALDVLRLDGDVASCRRSRSPGSSALGFCSSPCDPPLVFLLLPCPPLQLSSVLILVLPPFICRISVSHTPTKLTRDPLKAQGARKENTKEAIKVDLGISS